MFLIHAGVMTIIPSCDITSNLKIPAGQACLAGSDMVEPGAQFFFPTPPVPGSLTKVLAEHSFPYK